MWERAEQSRLELVLDEQCVDSILVLDKHAAEPIQELALRVHLRPSMELVGILVSYLWKVRLYPLIQRENALRLRNQISVAVATVQLAIA